MCRCAMGSTATSQLPGPWFNPELCEFCMFTACLHRLENRSMGFLVKWISQFPPTSPKHTTMLNCPMSEGVCECMDAMVLCNGLTPHP